jgi:cellulose synthase/poly-beta-1,6-N-acetylglucosamine synthase-like glycosyltransferase
MFELIFLFFLSGYFIQSVVFIIGAKKRFPGIKEDDLPIISVIVASRNEEKNILECITSLNQLEYPEQKLEIILADDNSSDTTGKIIDDFIFGKNKFKKIQISDDNGKLKGKVRAVSEAIKISKGEIIITTDADCEVKPGWVRAIASYYTDEVGVVNGYTTQTSNNFFGGMQAIDFIYLLTVAAGTININKPISCIGNNMSFRRKAYYEVGGYENIPFSVTEDFRLLMEIHKLGRYKIIFPLEAGALVTSKPCRNLSELFHQKKRWAIGGLEAPLRGYLIMFWGFFTNLLVLLTPFFLSPNWFYLVFFKLTTDFFTLYPLHSKLGIQKKMKYFLPHQIYFLVYVVLLPFILLFNRKVIWKGRKF